MFLLEKKEIVKTIDGVEIKFNYPSLTDEIQIESKKHVLTRGQYSSMSLGLLDSQQNVMDLVDALATLINVATFVGEKEKENYYWEGFADEDGKDFILKVYNEFLLWRQSFRKKDTGDPGKQESIKEPS